MKIAYLTNRYPAVSHSFIRREIRGLERNGVAIDRWSIRPPEQNLVDQSDRDERDQTNVLLANRPALLWGIIRAALTRPMATWHALRVTFAGRTSGFRSLISRIAYVAEGSFLARQLLRDGVDHLHAHFGTNPAAVARAAHILGGPPYSFTVHGPDEFDRPEELGLGAKIADSAFTVGISSYGRSQLQRWSEVEDWTKIAVVRCGVDEAFLKLPEESDEGLESRRLSCVGRLAPQKGLPLLVEAAAMLRDQREAFELVIVGDGPLRAFLETQIRRLRLSDQVSLVGAKDSAGVRDALLSSRTMVLPSFAEGLPVVLMEALALGRPTITTSIAGIPELVDAKCGWLIPAGSAEALATAMKEALNAPTEQLRGMGAEGRRRVLEKHNADDNAAVLLTLIEKHRATESHV